MSFDFYDIIHALIFFQLAVLIAVLLQKGRNYHPNRVLAFFLFAQLTASFNAIWWNHLPLFLENSPSLGLLAWPFSYTWGPSMYLFIVLQNKSNHKISPIHLLHYLPAFLLTIYLVITFHCFSTEEKVEMIKLGKTFPQLFPQLFNYTMIVQVAVYNIFAIVLFERRSKRNPPKNQRTREKANWNKFILYGYFFTCMVYNLHVFASPHFLPANLFKYFSYTIFAVYFTAILYKAIVSQLFVYNDQHDEVKRNLLLPETELEKIVRQLENMMRNEKPFLNENYGLKEMAMNIGLNERLLSQAVNECRKQNINDFINEHRIEEAKRIISENLDPKKTFLEIAYESGFNSKSAFYLVFKKNTGLTPSEFKKQQLDSKKG